MADNTVLPGTGETYASTDKGGVKYQKVDIGIYDGPSHDAFGRFRVSNPVTEFDSKLIGLDDAPLFWDEQLTSGAGITASTPTAAKPYIDFSSSLDTAGVFVRQTFRRFNYQPGKSQLIIMTGVLDLSGGGTGVKRCIGYFDGNNGAFFEDNVETIGVTLRTNDSGTPVDSTVTQTNWNLDNLDGGADAENPSGDTADWTKAQIFIIDFQWPSGRVRFGVELHGEVHYVHEIDNANSIAIPWCSTPNLPLRFEIITTGNSPASTMRCIGGEVISEGGQNHVGPTHSHATVAHINANTADTVVYALLGIRLKATHVGCNIEPVDVSVIAETADDFEWQLIHNATVAGTFDFTDLSNSCVQTATGNTSNPSTNTVTGGTVIARGFGSGSSDINIDLSNSLELGVAIDGTTLDTLVLAVRPLGSNADIQGALTWREII